MKIREITFFRNPIRWLSWYCCWKAYEKDLRFKYKIKGEKE